MAGSFLFVLNFAFGLRFFLGRGFRLRLADDSGGRSFPGPGFFLYWLFGFFLFSLGFFLCFFSGNWLGINFFRFVGFDGGQFFFGLFCLLNPAAPDNQPGLDFAAFDLRICTGIVPVVFRFVMR